MAKKKHRHSELSEFRIVSFLVGSLCILGLAAIGQPVPASHTTVHRTTTTAAKHVTTKPQTKAAQTTRQPVATTAPSQVQAKTTPTTRVVATVPKSSKPEPVAKPSPAASVSSLAPVTPSGSSGSSSAPQSSQTMAAGYTSSNWSGYMATNGSFNAISGAWTAPKPIGISGEVSADSTWIGIGGVTTNDLIQVGTQDEVLPNGRVVASAFYELLPSSSIAIPAITVTPGDSMAASLTEITSGEWTISIVDQTNGESFTTNAAYHSADSSAEWIEEDPSFSFRDQIPFDNFQSVTFSGGVTTVNGTISNISSSSALPVTMLNSSNQPLATPSALVADGTGFTITHD